jgi:hypothetical protein
MTDAQLGLIIAAVSALGAAFVKFLHWAFVQWIADRKEEREQIRTDRREDRLAVVEVGADVKDVQLTLAAMLERDRVRDDRRKRDSIQPQIRGRGPVVPVGEDWEEQSSNVVEIKERMRQAGARPARPGTHHDEDK